MSENENAPRSRTSLWLSGSSCASLPSAASGTTFFISPPPRAHVNYERTDRDASRCPPRDCSLADGSEFTIERLHGKWVLLMADAGACTADCRGKLFALRQLRLTQAGT